MPRKKKDPNAPKVPRKVREAKPAPTQVVSVEIVQSEPDAPLPDSPAVEQNAVGTLVDLKPAPPAASAPFGIGARRG